MQRRVEQLVAEGVELRCGVDVGRDVSVEELRASFDAVVLATGSRVPRDLPVPGRELDGVHFAMDYLYQRNRWVASELGPVPTVAATGSPARRSRRAGKDVVVIGGGDTGADCVGNAMREGAPLDRAAGAALRAAAARVPTTARPGRCGRRSTASATPWRRPASCSVGEQDYSVATTRFTGDGRAP